MSISDIDRYYPRFILFSRRIAMRWRNGQRSDTIVITYNGRPGACAAAAVLLKFPYAGIFVSSSFNIHKRLINIAVSSPDVTKIHICGMGCKGSLAELTDGLKALSDNGVQVDWYSGDYWKIDFEDKIKDYCNTHFRSDTGSDTEVIVDTLGLKGRDEVPSLLNLSDKDKNVSGLEKDFSDLVKAGMFRYFQFGDLDAYPAAIRKLSSNFPLPPEDMKAIRSFKSVGEDEGLDGSSEVIKKIKKELKMYGSLDGKNVLILGETGVGKERAARLLHYASPRSNHPFFCENCATLTGEGLINSRLFGHVKGAFTGAIDNREGILEAADGGTLFLDEIGEMPLETQAKFLRVLDTGRFTPVGSTQEMFTDIRIISATNQDISKMIDNGKFRIDLYYRLCNFVIDIPPLRHRIRDIPMIASSIRRKLEKEYDRPFPSLSMLQLSLLQNYEWPGNIRELENVLSNVYLLDKVDNLDEILKAHIETHRRNIADYSYKPSNPASYDFITESPKIVTIEELTAEYAKKALESFDNNKTQTAKALGITVNTLNKKLEG